MARQAADILQTTSVPARPDELNTAYFKTLHRPAVEWRDAYHKEYAVV